MGKGLTRSMSGASLKHVIIKQVLKPRAMVLPGGVDGAAGVGFGSAVIGDFPAGNVLLLGAVAYLQFAGPGGDAGLSDTWAGDFGIGTTPAGDGTLSAADVDIIPSTALAAATAEVSPRTRGVEPDGSLAGVVFDNTDGSLEINASVLVDDADISADNIVFIVTGEVFISYVMLGDD